MHALLSPQRTVKHSCFSSTSICIHSLPVFILYPRTIHYRYSGLVISCNIRTNNNVMIRVTSCIILAATLAVAGAMDTEQPMRWDGIKDASNMSMPRSISRPKRSRPHITSVEDDLASNFLKMKVSNICNL